MRDMLKASGLVGAATLISRFLGLAREIVYARFMGDSAVAGAFHFAFIIPNLLRRLLGEGALTAAFIPIFKEKEKEGAVEMWRAANAVLSCLIILTTGLTAIVILVVSLVLAWADLSANTTLMLQLLRVMFPYMIFVCIAAALMGMLNSRGHFFIPALGAAILNVVMIASVLWLAPVMGEKLEQQVFGLAIGVLAAGAAQAFFQMPSLAKEGFRFTWINPWKDPTVKRVLQKMIPATLGLAAFQLNITITQGLAFGIYAPIVASFQYASRLLELPQGLFGAAVASWLLPTLSSFAADKKYPEFRKTLGDAVSYLWFLNLLAVILLVVLAEPMVKVLFQRGEFTAESTRRVASALMFLAPSLLFFSTTGLLSRAFYALGDTKTPVKTGVASIIVNLILSVLLVFEFHQVGLAVASSFSAGCNAWLQLFALRKTLGKLDLDNFKKTLLPTVSAGLLAALVAWIIRTNLRLPMIESLWIRDAVRLFLAISIPSILYVAICFWLRVPAAQQLIAVFRRKVSI